MSESRLLVGDSILIVDDEEGIRDLFKMIVTSYMPGVHCEEARDGAQALEAFRRGHHAVLIMDLQMPVMDGLTSFDRLNEFCRVSHHEMPSVIFCTGYAPPDTVTRIVHDNRRHALLRKPVRKDVLLDSIRERLPSGSRPVRP